MAAEIASKEPRIDVLINNAGAMFANRRLTEDGLECTFALNHMAYFVITEGLRERLLASAPARIVSTASAAHQGARLCSLSASSAGAFIQTSISSRAVRTTGIAFGWIAPTSLFGLEFGDDGDD